MANDIKAWYYKYGPMVIRRCWYMLSPKTYRTIKTNEVPDEVKNAVQQVFLNLLEADANDNLELWSSTPSSLIYKTATNVCLNILREKKPFPLFDEIEDDNDDHEQVEAELLTSAIRVILERENEMTRTICRMYFFDEKEVEEIVKTVELKKSRIYDIINHFKKKVRIKLGKINLERIKK